MDETKPPGEDKTFMEKTKRLWRRRNFPGEGNKQPWRNKTAGRKQNGPEKT
jgi:hypothetical protein